MDAILATINLLLADSVVTALVGENVYGGQLPEHYNPEASTAAEPSGDGPAITIIVKGGTTHSEMPLQNVDVQLTIWAGVNQNYAARQVYEACFKLLHGLTGSTSSAGTVARMLATVPAQDVVDQETGWVTLICAFNMMLIDNTGS